MMKTERGHSVTGYRFEFSSNPLHRGQSVTSLILTSSLETLGTLPLRAVLGSEEMCQCARTGACLINVAGVEKNLHDFFTAQGT